jgi:Flp pilus assembly protein TadG
MMRGSGQASDAKKLARGCGGRRTLHRFGGDASGTSALEFAIVAAPLLLLLLAVLQMAFVFFANFSLENAVDRAARLVRTGQAQSYSASDFKSKVCQELTAPLTCSALQLDVRSYASFGAAASGLIQPLDADGNVKTNFSYDPGARGDVMVVRAFYPLDIGALLPDEISLSNMAGNDRVLVATAAFRNEPF